MAFFKHTIISVMTVCGLCATFNAEAATFKTPKNYTIIMADGAKVGSAFSSVRELTLDAGRHQIMVLFKGKFKKGTDRILTSASNPIVINIPNMAADDEYSFTYPRIYNYDDAQDFADKQVITLTNHGNNTTNEQVSYFILQSEKGFQLDRNFKDELASLGLLYVAPKNVQTATKKEDTLKKCRDSNMQDCPQVVVSPANTSNNKVAVAVPTNANVTMSDEATKVALNNPNVNQGVFEGLKSIYNSADPATKAAFKAWMATQK